MHALECLMKFSQLYVLHIVTAHHRIFNCKLREVIFKVEIDKDMYKSSILQKRLTSLALISIEKEFLLADVKNEIVQIFSDRRAYMGNRNRKL